MERTVVVHVISVTWSILKYNVNYTHLWLMVNAGAWCPLRITLVVGKVCLLAPYQRRTHVLPTGCAHKLLSDCLMICFVLVRSHTMSALITWTALMGLLHSTLDMPASHLIHFYLPLHLNVLALTCDPQHACSKKRGMNILQALQAHHVVYDLEISSGPPVCSIQFCPFLAHSIHSSGQLWL